MEDPYHGVRSDVDDLLRKAADIATQVHRRGAEDPEYQKQTAQLKNVISSIEEHLLDLTEMVDVVSADPARFNLTQAEFEQRKRFVTDATTQMNNLKAAARPQPVHGTASGGRKGGGAAAQQRSSSSAAAGDGQSEMHSVEAEHLLAEQDQALRDQDEDLVELGHAVVRVKDLSKEIGGELGRQDKLLDQMSSKMDKVGERLKQTNRKIDNVIDKMSTRKQYACIAVLAVILLILCVLKLS